MRVSVDWNTLSDVVALIVLVGVFASLLRRRSDDGLRLWLVAWLLIVAHFIAKLCDPSGDNALAQAASFWALQLAGFFFIRGVGSRYPSAARIPLFLAIVVPNLTIGGLAVWSVEDRLPYVLALAACVVGHLAIGRAMLAEQADRIAIEWAAASYIFPVAATLLFAPSPTYSLFVSLTWVYLFAGWKFWRRTTRYSAGIGTTTFGFLTWGLVFPLGLAQDRWWPDVHVDGTTWNIPKYIVAIGIIVTLLEEEIERVNHLAGHDEVTGLPNRRAFEVRLESLVARAGAPFALIALDLDRVKAIVDGLGHAADDELLEAVARRFERQMGPADVCARYGGSEFAVLLDGCADRHAAERRARVLLATLTEPIPLRGERVTVNANVGIALYPDDGRDAAALHASADHDAYAAERMRAVGLARG
jgi:diguanylate cyclase (GGDEF)-like protein